MYAVRGQHLNVCVIQERNAVQVNHFQIGRMGLDFSNVDDFIYVFF